MQSLPNQGTGSPTWIAQWAAGVPVPRALWSNGMYAFTPTSGATTMKTSGSIAANVVVGSYLMVGEMPTLANWRMIFGHYRGNYAPFYLTATGWACYLAGPAERLWSGVPPAAGTKFAMALRINAAASKLDIVGQGYSGSTHTIPSNPGTASSGAIGFQWGRDNFGAADYWGAPLAALGAAPINTFWSDVQTAAILAEAQAEYGLT